MPKITQLGSDGAKNQQLGLPASGVHAHHRYDECRANAQKRVWKDTRKNTNSSQLSVMRLSFFLLGYIYIIKKKFYNGYEFGGWGQRECHCLVGLCLRSTASPVTTYAAGRWESGHAGYDKP